MDRMDIRLILLSCQNSSLNPFCPIAMKNAELALGGSQGGELEQDLGMRKCQGCATFSFAVMLAGCCDVHVNNVSCLCVGGRP
jgi:hypothetical protein